MRVLFLLIAIVLLTPVVVHACTDYEYAELQNMDKKSFLKEYCEVRKTLRSSPFTSGGCLEIVKKMERVYSQRFNVDRELVKYDCPDERWLHERRMNR